MLVAPSSATALTAQIVCAVVVGHIVNDLAALLVLYKRSGRNENDEIIGSSSVELSALAITAVLGNKFVAVFECQQGVAATITTRSSTRSPFVWATGVAISTVFVFTSRKASYARNVVISPTSSLKSLGGVSRSRKSDILCLTSGWSRTVCKYILLILYHRLVEELYHI